MNNHDEGIENDLFAQRLLNEPIDQQNPNNY